MGYEFYSCTVTTVQGNSYLQTVLRIHDILVWIRIRGSMPLTNGSGCGSGSFYFHHWPSRCQQKTYFKKKFFCMLLFEGTFTSFFKGKKSKRCHKKEENKVFCLMIEGSGSIPLTNGSGSGSRRPKKNVDPDHDSDLQHCLQIKQNNRK